MSESWEPRSVAVVGAGAIGSLFGGLLQAGGLDVTLIDIWEEHIRAIQKDGLKITGYGGDRVVRIGATTSVAEVGVVDVVVVQTKTRHTAEAARSALPLFGENTVAATFQNGLGNAEVIGDIVGMEKVLGGVTAQGSGIVAPGTIAHAGSLPSFIGELQGGISERASAIASAFTDAGLLTIASENITRDIWKKLLANIGINAMSALGNFRVGELFDVPEVREVVLEAIDEAALVAIAAGVDLDADEAKDVIFRIMGKGGTGSNRSGMLVDVLNKRKTEIDAINGAVVRLGKQHGIPTPISKTLVAAVKGLERNFS